MAEPTDLVYVAMGRMDYQVRTAYRRLGPEIVNALPGLIYERTAYVQVPRSFAHEHRIAILCSANFDRE